MTLNTRISMRSTEHSMDVARTPATCVRIRCLVLLAVTLSGTAATVTSAADPAAARPDTEAIRIDGAELFTREWIPGDPRSHGGDGLGPVFNDSSCVACHNQGGTGGAGSASKNVEIVTAIHAPDRNRNSVPQMSIPGILFQSVFGNLNQTAGQQTQQPVDQSEAASEEEGQTTAGDREQARAAAQAQQNRQAELQKKMARAERRFLSRIHPGFAHANSVVLHRDATFQGYRQWRSRAGGSMGFSFSTSPQQATDLFEGELSAVSEVEAEAASDGNRAARAQRGQTQIAQLRQEIQASRFSHNHSQRQGAFVITKSQRNTTALFGAGLIDSIPTTALEAIATQQKKNPVISGRVARLKDGRAGRFGWKAQKARLSDFVLTACAVEVGLNVPAHPQAGHPLNPAYAAPGLDLNQDECNALIQYVAELPAPARRNFADGTDGKYIQAGHTLFTRIGCADCHTETVGQVTGIFSDLLLHNMGQELGDTGSYDVFIPDTTPEGQTVPLASRTSQSEQADEKIVGATHQEWRTPPLWGIRDSAPYLHDGRAQTLAQAIALHGGESTQSARKFFELSDAEQFQILSFMKTLVAPLQQASAAR